MNERASFRAALVHRIVAGMGWLPPSPRRRAGTWCKSQAAPVARVVPVAMARRRPAPVGPRRAARRAPRRPRDRRRRAQLQRHDRQQLFERRGHARRRALLPERRRDVPRAGDRWGGLRGLHRRVEPITKWISGPTSLETECCYRRCRRTLRYAVRCHSWPALRGRGGERASRRSAPAYAAGRHARTERSGCRVASRRGPSRRRTWRTSKTRRAPSSAASGRWMRRSSTRASPKL